MKKYYFLTLLLMFIFLCSSTNLSAQARNMYGFTMGASFPVGTTPKNSNTMQFSKYAGIGASLSFKYAHLWDGIISPKDALGFFGELGAIWNPFNKSMLDELNENETAGDFINTFANLGPTYVYYFGKSEDVGLFAELGILFGSMTQLKSSTRYGFGVGGTAGIGIYYSTWLSFGFHYYFLGRSKVSSFYYDNTTEKRVMPSILQLRVGFHF